MKELVTRKLYYKKWTHRVCFRVERNWYPEATRRQRKKVTPYIIYEELGADWSEKDYRTLESSTWSARDYSLTVYFKDEKILELLKSKFDYAIEEIEKPESDKHIQALETEKCLVREKYFYDTYPYAIRIKPDTSNWGSRKTQFDRLIKWVNTAQKNVKRTGKDYVRINSEWNMTIFFQNAQDAMLFRLSNPDDIKSVERIKLISDCTGD